MYGSAKFNIFEENLQGIVYGNVKKHKAKNKTVNARAIPSAVDKPIPKPVPDFWRPDFIAKFINYKPLKVK